MFYLVLLVFSLGALFHTIQGQNCFDDQGDAQFCAPPFLDPSFDKPVDATNTCGLSGPTEYCPLLASRCQICDAQAPRSRHPASYITDQFGYFNPTWWQSGTMFDGVGYPVAVNLTFDFKKAYDITYIDLRFQAPVPESFAIYKKTRENDEWTAFQFFSASCQGTYGKNDATYTTNPNEAMCTSEYSDVYPFTGASVPFSTLAGRPGAMDFDYNPVLQEWVTATAIKISLTRMNTFGDEMFGDERVLKSYYYAISDIGIGARCKCNGHASECFVPNGEDSEVCRCEHNTDGIECDRCLPMYNDKPWARATQTSANECQRCECNNKADRCYFDEDLYQRTGRGGHCVDCRDNTDGPHCERCKDNFSKNSEGECIPTV
uniref:Laminin subunit gamma-1-like n=1 Tax=Crassostrea virginica TaxID=6565 RepID=A0A8B8DF31_CRAVI|nr:laminin subunit gamma-1-like [Crassostrea virginica]